MVYHCYSSSSRLFKSRTAIRQIQQSSFTSFISRLLPSTMTRRLTSLFSSIKASSTLNAQCVTLTCLTLQSTAKDAIDVLTSLTITACGSTTTLGCKITHSSCACFFSFLSLYLSSLALQATLFGSFQIKKN